MLNIILKAWLRIMLETEAEHVGIHAFMYKQNQSLILIGFSRVWVLGKWNPDSYFKLFKIPEKRGIENKVKQPNLIHEVRVEMGCAHSRATQGKQPRALIPQSNTLAQDTHLDFHVKNTFNFNLVSVNVLLGFLTLQAKQIKLSQFNWVHKKVIPKGAEKGRIRT